MANYDYEMVNGRKIWVRPKETVSEIDKNGYFRRQPNHFTTPFGDGENDLKAEENKRYRLIWAKLCHWSNRAAIVSELEGLEDQSSVNMVEHAPHTKNPRCSQHRICKIYGGGTADEEGSGKSSTAD